MIDDDIADDEVESRGCSHEFWIGSERELRFGNADGKAVETLVVNQGEHLLRLLAECDTSCTIDFLDYGLDFVLGSIIVLIGEVENRF